MAPRLSRTSWKSCAGVRPHGLRAQPGAQEWANWTRGCLRRSSASCGRSMRRKFRRWRLKQRIWKRCVCAVDMCTCVCVDALDISGMVIHCYVSVNCEQHFISFSYLLLLCVCRNFTFNDSNYTMLFESRRKTWSCMSRYAEPWWLRRTSAG